MPARNVPLVNNEYYHIFNRGINKQPIFLGVKDYNRSLDLLQYYSYSALSLRFSKFLLLSLTDRLSFRETVQKRNEKLVDIVCFCIMPNHFHFLLKQKIDNGISRFLANFQNSYTRYFNTKYSKIGPILQGQFKAVRVEDDSQLLHLSRYIHLNPYTSFIVKTLDDLLAYPWSSFQEYLGETNENICTKNIILSQFKNIVDYKNFVFDHAGYQRELDKIKHLILEENI